MGEGEIASGFGSLGSKWRPLTPVKGFLLKGLRLTVDVSV